MGRPAITSFIVREEHSVLKFWNGRRGLAVRTSNCNCKTVKNCNCKMLYCNNKLS